MHAISSYFFNVLQQSKTDDASSIAILGSSRYNTSLKSDLLYMKPNFIFQTNRVCVYVSNANPSHTHTHTHTHTLKSLGSRFDCETEGRGWPIFCTTSAR